MLKSCLPKQIIDALDKVPYNSLCELRIRANNPLVVNILGENYFLGKEKLSKSSSDSLEITQGELQSILHRISNNSMYTINDQLIDGYVTIPGGIRVGICGEVVTVDGTIKTVKNISSLNFRFPHLFKNCSLNIYPYIFKNGRVQVGEYVQDKMCGYCFDYSTNNHFNLAFYDNFVKKGIFYSVSFGQVWIAMCNGDKLIKNIYKGPIKNTMFPGIPTVPISFKYFGDDLYFGELINGKMHGFGKLLLPNQDKYIGYFQNNEFCGVGAYCFSDGSVYLGQFKDSQFHGLGVMINIDKTYDVSIYENGEEVKYLV